MENILFIKQSTLQKSISIYGRGIHSKKKTKLKLKPNKKNSGIVIRKIHAKSFVDIPVLITNIVNNKFSTTIGKNDIYIKTIEHLLSAISMLGIDNILIELYSEEIPIMDGSAYAFVFIINSCGIQKLNDYKRFLLIKKEINLQSCISGTTILPSKKINIVFGLNFRYNFFKFINFNTYNYMFTIAKSRTFGFADDYINLLSHNFAHGTLFNNVLIFHNNKIFNKNLFRYNNENIKHKVLDFLGDVSLLGKCVIGSFLTIMPGHLSNNKTLHHLLYKQNSYDLMIFHRYFGFVKY